MFHKVHPTSTEVIPGTYFKSGGITPGPIKSAVCKTDFGTIGMQICADADWTDGWHSLKEEGAEIVCFPSQGPYSNTLRNRAWVNHYYIVSATGEDAQIMKYVTTVNNKRFEIEILADGSITVDGKKREVDFKALGPAMYSILAENVSHELTIEERDFDRRNVGSGGAKRCGASPCGGDEQGGRSPSDE